MPRILTAILLYTLLCSATYAADKVVLQLKWHHEFQFAGYYAALWQGYYDDLGLDVSIQPIVPEKGYYLDPPQEVGLGRAQFGVGALDILVANDKGYDLTILASIFQRSPTAIYTLEENPIENLSQLAQLNPIAAAGTGTQAEIKALFKSRGFNLQKINFVDAPPTIKSLVENKAEAILTYEASAEMQAIDLGVSLNKLRPANYGVNFYGDTLYTSSAFAKRNPELVRKFVEASLKGWQYALSHKKELAEKISSKYSEKVSYYQNFHEYNLRFSEHIDGLVNSTKLSLGHINQQRWHSMNEKLRSLGIVNRSLSSDFFFTAKAPTPFISESSTILIIIMVIVATVFYFWYQRNIIATLISIILLMGVVDYATELNLTKEQKQIDRIRLLEKLNSITAKLEGNLQNNLSLLSGFAAYISASPELTYDEYKNYAREVFKKDPLLVNFAAAKDLVINYVYPVEGNEKAIGLDYRENEAQWDMVKQVTKTGQTLVVGPINLVQGGVAFIGRIPIYTGDDKNRKLWGIISSPIDAERLYNSANIETAAKEFNLAIKSFDSLGIEGPTFFGLNETFVDPEAIHLTISVGGGTWHLAATPLKQGSLSSNIIVIRSGIGATTVILCAFVWFRFRQETEKSRLQSAILSNQKLLEKVGSVARIGGWKLDFNFNFIQWSNQSSKIFSSNEDFYPRNLKQLENAIEHEYFEKLLHSVDLAFKDDRPIDMEVKLSTSEDNSRWIRIIANISESESRVITGTVQDVTEEVKARLLIEHQATYDQLTNLPNRVLFNDRLNQAIENANRHNEKVGVLFIDLDRFKPVNDNHGHQVGDNLLVQAANRILSNIRDSDTLSRLSGDEFGVILNNIRKYDDALKVTENIIESMQAPFVVEELTLHCSASIGVTFYPDDGVDAETLFRKADQAMYEVKNSGRNAWQFYTKEMQAKSEYRHQLLNELIIAVSQEKLIPYYQPIVDLKSKQISKCESLARWFKEDGRFVPPSEFIELAEESGLVNKIDLSILKQSAQYITGVNRQNTPIGLSVNVSPRLFQTKDKALSLWLEQVTSANQTIQITVEITERLLTEDSGKAATVLHQLSSAGVKIAIDDFGTGYSSLSYLIKFPVDIIKIDRSFIDGIGKDLSSESLIETILIMANKLNLDVIAEGIETQQQLDFLVSHGCQFGQGYFLGKPMSEDDFNQIIHPKVDA